MAPLRPTSPRLGRSARAALALVVVTLVGGLLSSPASADVTTELFLDPFTTVLRGIKQPESVTTGPDGNVWFTTPLSLIHI